MYSLSETLVDGLRITSLGHNSNRRDDLFPDHHEVRILEARLSFQGTQV